MLCYFHLKTRHTGIFIFFFFFLSFLFSSYCLSSNSFALSETRTIDLTQITRNTSTSFSNLGFSVSPIYYIRIDFSDTPRIGNCGSYISNSSSNYRFRFDLSWSSSIITQQFNSDNSFYVFSSVPGQALSSLWFSSSSGAIYCSLDSIDITVSDVYISSTDPVPSGSLSISENGIYDVTNYAQAVVDVPPEIVQGDYHDDLLRITQGIYICAGVMLVLYFFYCIYRLFIKGSRGSL